MVEAEIVTSPGEHAPASPAVSAERRGTLVGDLQQGLEAADLQGFRCRQPSSLRGRRVFGQLVDASYPELRRRSRARGCGCAFARTEHEVEFRRRRGLHLKNRPGSVFVPSKAGHPEPKGLEKRDRVDEVLLAPGPVAPRAAVDKKPRVIGRIDLELAPARSRSSAGEVRMLGLTCCQCRGRSLRRFEYIGQGTRNDHP